MTISTVSFRALTWRGSSRGPSQSTDKLTSIYETKQDGQTQISQHHPLKLTYLLCKLAESRVKGFTNGIRRLPQSRQNDISAAIENFVFAVIKVPVEICLIGRTSVQGIQTHEDH